MLILRKRLIAFFDVLGFSNRLRTMDLGDLVVLQSSLIQQAKSDVVHPRTMPGSPNPVPPNFERDHFLFDSIVLVSKPTDSIKHVSEFITGAVHLMEICFEKRMPLRGAISFGDYIADDQMSVMLSPAFPDLVRAEKMQDWSGCCILPPAVSLVEEAVHGRSILTATDSNLSNASAILPYRVPLKTVANEQPAEFRTLCLNWVTMMTPSNLEFGLDFLTGEKRANTESFVQYVSSLRDETQVLDAAMAPAHTMHVMKTRSQLRHRFLDRDGNPTKPAGDFYVAVFEQPKE